MSWPRSVLLGLSLLILTLYLPLAAMIYLPVWYRLNCDWHGRCAALGTELQERSIRNLNAFFAHREALHERWSAKERRHLSEVRGIYDALAILALLAALSLWASFDRRRLRTAACVNIALIASLLLLLPVFGYFWRHVFHALVFDNELWRTDRGDLTWYLTPRSLFRNALLLLVAAGVALNALAAFAAGRARRPD